MTPVVVTAAKRTPIGGFQGGLAPMTAPELGAAAIRSALSDSSFSAQQIDEVQMGCVLSAGLGQAPSRQASLGAGIPEQTPCTTVNKMCGSGMQTVIAAHDRIALGHARTAVAGGMESMSNSPYLIPKMRAGARMGHAQAADHMFLDGLEDAYDKGRLMGEFAEECAADYQFTRQEQDAFAVESLSRALNSQKQGRFAAEIQPLAVRSRRNTACIQQDEQPSLAKPDRIPHLKPAFKEGGTVTAANSSSISDGAAALVLASEDAARRSGAPVLARIAGQSTVATQPSRFTTAPSLAVQALLSDLSWKPDQVDLWEVNEAFAVVCMAFMQDIGAPREKLNVNGGACALGHPIGASGARILVTLIHAMHSGKLNRGIAAVCIGGGEATALALERV